MFLVAVFLQFLFGIAYSDPFKCDPGTTKIDMSGGKTFYFPVNGVLSPTEYISPLSCTWSLNVPAGQYAKFLTIMNLNLKDDFAISGPGGNYNHKTVTGDVPRSGQQKFYIPAGDYTITLTSNSGLTNGTFTFSASLNQLPSKISRTVSANTQQAVSLSTFVGEQTLLTSTRQFTLRTIDIGCGNDYNYFYDACLLYKGENAATGTFVSGLYNYLGGVPPTLIGTYTLVCFAENFVPGSSLLITGKPEIQPLDTWKVLSGCVDISLAAFSANSAYVTDFCANDCTKYLAHVDTNILSGLSVDMYSGSIGDEYSYLGSITHSNYINSLPQQINGGKFKTFRIKDGSMTIMVTPDQGGWPIASPRSGFISSPNYGMTSSYQTFQTSISSNKRYSFSYTVNSIDSGTLKVEIDQGSSSFTDSFTNSSQKLKNTVAGYGIKFNYQFGSGSSKGMLAHYEISEYNSASRDIVLVLLSALLFINL